MKNKKKEPTMQEFLLHARPIINTDKFKQLKKFIHHADHTVYRHSISVAYIAYKMSINKKNIDLASLIKVCLLHDYYLYDWHKKYHKRPHGFTHPKTAMNNATRDFKLTTVEQKAIRSHMWPLTLFHIPTSKIGIILCIADKRSAHYEYSVDKMIRKNRVKIEKLKEKYFKKEN